MAEATPELRCRRCGTTVQSTGHAVYFSEKGEVGWLPLCPPHMEEAWDLLMLYVAGSIDVLPHQTLAVRLVP